MGKGRFGVLGALAVLACLGPNVASGMGWPQAAHAARSSRWVTGGNAWAVVVGIDSYPRPTLDTVGSTADARTLTSALLAQGWRADHIFLLLDGEATRDRVSAGLRWLASNADESSTVVVHYSGHERDGSLLLADNRQMSRRELGGFLRQVRSRTMWIDLVACNAAGLLDRSALKPGDLATLSSRPGQDSFGDTTLGHSIYGHYALSEAIGRALGDADRDGSVSIQEAFAYAKQRVEAYTLRRQSPVMIDLTNGRLTLQQRGTIS